jgi:heptosyltransferase I
MARLEPRRILIVRLSAVGDTIHALALANGLRRGFPEAEITWILERVPHDVVRNQPAIDDFIVFNARGGISAWRQLYRDLARRRFDLVIVPQVSSKAALVASLTRADVRLGFDRARSREIHSLAINARIDPHPLGHAQDQFLEFLEWLGVDSTPEWNIRFTDEEEERSAAFFASIGRPVLGLVLASSHPEKDWPAERYAALADQAFLFLGMQPMLVGGPSEAERRLAEEIASRTTSKPIIALDKPIRDSLFKLRGSAVVVSPDTGPLHASVAMNTPTVGLYGYTDPLRTGPYRKFHDLLVQKYRLPGEEDEPVSRRTKPGRVRMITVEEVLEKVRVAARSVEL